MICQQYKNAQVFPHPQPHSPLASTQNCDECTPHARQQMLLLGPDDSPTISMALIRIVFTRRVKTGKLLEIVDVLNLMSKILRRAGSLSGFDMKKPWLIDGFLNSMPKPCLPCLLGFIRFLSRHFLIWLLKFQGSRLTPPVLWSPLCARQSIPVLYRVKIQFSIS
ncbi:hypothetical protein C8J57DRAFT_1395815 [Mycena rebaudengoi]|nr:hypothetical protein C8J57DRAFT_1395815 [Mycena rebaudengoi]